MTRQRGQLTDDELVKLARHADRLKAKAEKAKEAADEAKAEVCEEFIRRGTKSLTHGGFKVTFVQQMRTNYNGPGILTDRRIPLSLRKKITKHSLDTAELSRMVQGGTIDAVVVDEYAEVLPSAPYFSLTRAD